MSLAKEHTSVVSFSNPGLLIASQQPGNDYDTKRCFANALQEPRLLLLHGGIDSTLSILEDERGFLQTQS